MVLPPQVRVQPARAQGEGARRHAIDVVRQEAARRGAPACRKAAAAPHAALPRPEEAAPRDLAAHGAEHLGEAAVCGEQQRQRAPLHLQLRVQVRAQLLLQVWRTSQRVTVACKL